MNAAGLIAGFQNRGQDCQGVFAQRVITRTFADVAPAMKQCTGRIWSQLWEDPFLYASEDGEIISLHKKRAIVLKQPLSGEYPAVNVNGRTKHVHRIVCEMWHGPQPFPGAEVRHLDGDKFNNALSNLCWGSYNDQWQDKLRHGTHNKGHRNGQAKLTYEKVREMRAKRAAGSTFKSIAQRFGVSLTTARRAIIGVNWNER